MTNMNATQASEQMRTACAEAVTKLAYRGHTASFISKHIRALQEIAIKIRELQSSDVNDIQPTSKACKCSMSIKLLGDGCDICNPEMAEQVGFEEGDEL